MNFKSDLIPQLQWNYGKLRIPSYLNILLPDISKRLYENNFQRWCRIIEIVPISHLILRFVLVFDLLQFYWTRIMKVRFILRIGGKKFSNSFFHSSNESFNWIWDKRKNGGRNRQLIVTYIVKVTLPVSQHI